MQGQIPKLPEDTHIFRMTDDTGMLQHSTFDVPNPEFGYTTDDNARALIMAVMLYEATGDNKYLNLAYRYLSFLFYAKKGKWFRNFMDYGRRFTEKRGSHDCFGRCIWSLGYASSQTCLPSSFRQAADFLLRETIEGCRELRFLRSKAYTILGLCLWEDDRSQAIIKKLADDMADAFGRISGSQWRWFENKVTYCNAVLPLAMLEAYQSTGERDYFEIGLESLEFLSDITFKNGVFNPVGCKGWMERGKNGAEYDQQPVEACETLILCLKAFELTKDEKYRDRAISCIRWYTGNNISGRPLVNWDTGGCKDGITADGLNQNEGAESLISWWIALLSFRKASSVYAWDSNEWADLINQIKITA